MSRGFQRHALTSSLSQAPAGPSLWLEPAQPPSMEGARESEAKSACFNFGAIPLFPKRAAIQAMGSISPARARRAAALGISGASGALPHFDAIQRSFGQHSVKNIRAHSGGAARKGALHMGARAFTYGNHVAFAKPPDLYTAAHEAAHAVRQQHGLLPASGLGQEGDAHEQLANSVAQRVTQGQSSEGLLSQGLDGKSAPNPPSTPSSQAAAVQRLILQLTGNHQDLFGEKEVEYVQKAHPEENVIVEHDKAPDQKWPAKNQQPHAQRPLRAVAMNETLYVVGHGSPSKISYGGYKPKELASLFNWMGLRGGYQGDIWLHGCYAGVPVDNGRSYLELLFDAIREHGYKSEIYGLRGAAGGGQDVEYPFEFEVARIKSNAAHSDYLAALNKTPPKKAKAKAKHDLDVAEKEKISDLNYSLLGLVQKEYGKEHQRKWLKASELVAARKRRNLMKSKFKKEKVP